MDTIDIADFPVKFEWDGGPSPIGLHNTVLSLQPVMDKLMAGGFISPRESFGFAMANPGVDYSKCWNDPSKLIAFVNYWGPDGPRYAANAVRKIRAAAREGKDTQAIRLQCPELFQDEVEQTDPSIETAGVFPWGDFPFDGAVFVNCIDLRLLGAVSAYPKEQDPVVASLVLGLIGLDMNQISRSAA